MAESICSLAGCNEASHARGWCFRHYMRWRRHGDPNVTANVIHLGTDAERFWAKVDRGEHDECWLWTAARQPEGYGQFRRANRLIHAHRLSWELHNGPIPSGLFVMHRCDNPPCVNPAHLHLGTNADNMADMASKGRGRKATATHCPHGHAFDELNTYLRPDGARDCRACRRKRERERRSR